VSRSVLVHSFSQGNDFDLQDNERARKYKRYKQRRVDRPFARSEHMVQNHTLLSKLHNGTSKTKARPGGLVRVALFCGSPTAQLARQRV